MSEPALPCGCCEPASAPPTRGNPPGRRTLSYRIGTHGSFLARMMHGLPAQAHPQDPNARPLAPLSTRDVDDPTIALLDAWATVADVLTFYQERIANEGFLRTARERRSILELARAIGYELGPGAAASTHLAFTVEDSPGSPRTVRLDAGIKVMNVPRQDEKPQIFETIETIEARPEWNAMRPRRYFAQTKSVKRILHLKGVDTRLQVGDALLIVHKDRDKDPSSSRWWFRLVRRVETDPKEERTTVEFDASFGKADIPLDDVHVYALRQRASLFGHNAPDWRVLPAEVKKPFDPDWHAFDDQHWKDTIEEWKSDWEWFESFGQDCTSYWFDRMDDLQAAFGPDYNKDWRDEWPDFSIREADDRKIDLDQAYPKVVADSWVVLRRGTTRALYNVEKAVELSRTDYALVGKTTRLTLDTKVELENFGLRKTVVFCESERLELAEKPSTAPVAGNEILLDGLVPALSKGRAVAVRGRTLVDGKDDPPRQEVAFVQKTFNEQGRTVLVLDAALGHAYRRDDVTFCANVAKATHGETVTETLGSGDASRPHQTFVLHRPPLTYVGSATATGVESTLRMEVANVKWSEKRTLYEAGPQSEVFVLRADDKGQVAVLFGDGRRGARLPTGTENVVATYRTGVGLAGQVPADSLTMLQSRPLGLRSVSNPVAATGGDDPERLEDARKNAPLTVLTLDRIVSLQDFESFARAFGGVGDAKAAAIWDGEGTIVHVTAAASDGSPLDPKSDTSRNLLEAIESLRDPGRPVRIQGYEPVDFRIQARLTVAPKADAAHVRQRVEQVLIDRFQPLSREFGHDVTAAEVVTAIQRVPGVVAVDLDALYKDGDSATLHNRLEAHAARFTGGQILAGQVLRLVTGGVNLTPKFSILSHASLLTLQVDP